MKTLILISLALTCHAQTDLSDSATSFSIELLHFTAQQTKGHVVISPFGVWTLMTGISLGATGESNDQLRRAFFLPADVDATIKGYKNLTKIVLNPKTNVVLLTSKNFMFTDQNFAINPQFKKLVQDEFEASVKVLNFKDSASAAKTANNYIQNSGGRVSNVLTSDDFSNSRMILANAISFKGLWSLPFNKTDTTVENFYDENRRLAGQVNMMYQRAEFPFSNVQAIKGFAVELPYGDDGRYSMIVLLPHPTAKIRDMYANLAKVGLKGVVDKIQRDIDEYGLDNIDVRIPRFKISTNVVLNKPLQDMKVYDIFEQDKASFDNVSKEKLYVSAIVHKADIEVTESGTVASASTSATFADRISTPSFLANRPFVYFIIEKQTTTVIFAGIYSRPTKF